MSKQVRIPKQKRSIEKKQKIMEAAYRVFNQKGYFETYANDIAAEAGLAVGTIYCYFHDKKDILLACLEQDSQVIIHDMCREIAGTSETDDIFRSVKNILLILVKFHMSHSRLLHDEVNSLEYRDDDIGKYFSETQRTMMGALTKAIEAQGYAYEHTNEQLYLVWHMVDSIQDELAFGHNPDINHDVLIDDCARLILSMLIKKENQ